MRSGRVQRTRVDVVSITMSPLHERFLALHLTQHSNCYLLANGCILLHEVLLKEVVNVRI